MALFSLILMIYRGNLYQEQKRYQEALKHYDSAIHFRPNLAGKCLYMKIDLCDFKILMCICRIVSSESDAIRQTGEKGRSGEYSFRLRPNF